MPRRIDVEFTSAREDGTWTWRAAGARAPKGVVPSELVYPGAKVGDVVRAEADFDIDGITITAITPPPSKASAPGVIEITGSGEAFEPVTSSLVPRTDRPRSGGDRGDRGARGPRPGGDRGPRPAGGDRGPRPPGDRDGRPSPDRGSAGRPGGDRSRLGTTSGDQRAGRPDGARTDGGRPGGPRSDGSRRERAERPDGGRGDGGRPGGERADSRPRPKRLSPANTHRNAVLEALVPEQRAVAEQVLRGGIPAVRRAIAEQNTAAQASGQPEIKPGPLVAMAEDLLPRLKTAEWHDRADAAMADVEEIGLRDLRSVVSGGDAAARDDETRTLASQLREALERRLKAQQDEWVSEITVPLEDGRLVRALRVSARPPDPSLRFPADLALRLSSAASEAMAADTPSDRWMALLEAVAASPVRTTVKPAALPAEPGEGLLQAASQQAGRIPALTSMLGISMPPPPGPPRRIPPRPGSPVPSRPGQPGSVVAGPAASGKAPGQRTAPVTSAASAAESPAPAGHIAPAANQAPATDAGEVMGAVEPQPSDAGTAAAKPAAHADSPTDGGDVALPTTPAPLVEPAPSEAPAPVAIAQSAASAAGETPAETEDDPAPPTPLAADPPAEPAVPPEATGPPPPSDRGAPSDGSNAVETAD